VQKPTDQPPFHARFPRTLIEVAAACDEVVAFGQDGWIRTVELCGTADDRSTQRLKALMRDGHIEGQKRTGGRQGQWVWRVTEAGRVAIKRWSCTK
jgi:hypothetical protein